jgi:hypothetical protein
MIVAGKYVPPHMRNGAKLEPSVLPFQSQKKTTASPFAKWSRQEKNNTNEKNKQLNKKNKTPTEPKKTEKAVEEPKVEGPCVKPHCELFLADLPPSLRSVQTLAGFFHPYGEISNIIFVAAGKPFPADVARRELFDSADFVKSNCAVIEFLTARVAKFVVGVLRKRIEVLNFRIGLLKPGLAEEMVHQEQRLVESIHLPSFQINKTQTQYLEGSQGSNQYSSEELSEFEATIAKRVVKPAQADQAYYTGSSELSNTSDSDYGRYDTSDDDTDLLTLALKNGIKVIRD